MSTDFHADNYFGSSSKLSTDASPGSEIETPRRPDLDDDNNDARGTLKEPDPVSTADSLVPETSGPRRTRSRSHGNPGDAGHPEADVSRMVSTKSNSGHQHVARSDMTPVDPTHQNPPCDTLYVGNLPIDASEDELKAIFTKQLGYRRLCFRTKQNSPMCFVQFENIVFATKALNDLDKYLLRNSVEDGIRLSFSKNSLGVRDDQSAASDTSLKIQATTDRVRDSPTQDDLPKARSNTGQSAPAPAHGMQMQESAQWNPQRIFE